MKRAVVLLLALVLLAGGSGNRAAAGEPSATDAVARGLLYLQLGLQELALSQIESVAQREGASADTLVLYGLLLEVTGRTSKAADVLAKAESRVEAESQPELTVAEVRAFAAGALAAGGGTDEAGRRFSSAVAEQPDLGLARAGLAAVLEAQGKSSEAIQEYERYLDLAPEDGAAWASLGRLYAAAGRKEDALAALDHAVKLNPGLTKAVELLHQLKEQGK